MKTTQFSVPYQIFKTKLEKSGNHVKFKYNHSAGNNVTSTKAWNFYWKYNLDEGTTIKASMNHLHSLNSIQCNF